MTPREVTTEINIPLDVFVSNVKERIATYKRDTMDSLFSVEPHFQWDNVRLSNNKLIIERSAKPFDKTSRYRGVSGTIESEIRSEEGKTILSTKIMLDQGLGNFFKYVVGIAIAMIGLIWVIVDINYLMICFVIILEVVIFGVTPLMQSDNLDELTHYYNSVIRELSKK